jgi:hypothetical protein
LLSVMLNSGLYFFMLRDSFSLYFYPIISETNVMRNRCLFGKSSILLVSLILVVSMITSTAMTGNYAVAQNSSNSNMSSASVTNASASTQANSPYKFERGYPAPGTAERAYNDTDLGRAIEVYKFFYPTVSVESLFQDVASVLEPNQSAAKFHAGPQHQLLTGNGDTPYGSGRLDLNATGPIVFELPPNKFIGFANDHNFRWIVDMGINGPDKGQGGKYLILPPDYQGDVPSGYNVGRSDTWKAFFAIRSLSPEGNMTQALAALDGIKVYPLAKAGEPVTFQFVDVTNKSVHNHLLDWEGSLDYWKQLKAIVDSETTPAQFRAMYGMLQSLGIEKGKPFNPDARMTRILEEAAQTALAEMRVNSFANRNPERIVWNDRNWEWAPLRTLNTTTRDFGTASFQDLDTTSHAYFQAFGGSASLGKREVGAGSIYFVGLRDNTSAFLDGGKNYKLTVPGPVPADLFWSATVYDTDTRSMIVTDQDRAFVGSVSTKPQPNPDGSVDIYFGPEAPVGKEGQCVNTIPGKGWFVYFRIYGPEAAAFDGTWKLNNIVEMK